MSRVLLTRKSPSWDFIFRRTGIPSLVEVLLYGILLCSPSVALAWNVGWSESCFHVSWLTVRLGPLGSSWLIRFLTHRSLRYHSTRNAQSCLWMGYPGYFTTPGQSLDISPHRHFRSQELKMLMESHDGDFRFRTGDNSASSRSTLRTRPWWK